MRKNQSNWNFFLHLQRPQALLKRIGFLRQNNAKVANVTSIHAKVTILLCHSYPTTDIKTARA